jgi:hypothetical protein
MPTLPSLWADVCWYFAVKPCLHPPGGPLVFNSMSKLHSAALVMLLMKINAAKLLKHDTFIILKHLRLIMQHVAFCKAIARWHAAEAEYHRKILGQLNNGVGSQLVELHTKLVQNVHEHRLRMHAKPCCENLFKHNGLIVCRLQNNFFPGLPRDAFSEIVQGCHLPNANDRDDGGPEHLASGGLVWVHGFATFILRICGTLRPTVVATP